MAHVPPDHTPTTTTSSDVTPVDEPPVARRSFFARFKKDKKVVEEQPAAEQQQQQEAAPSVKYYQLFRHATRIDRVYTAIACLAAAIHGALMPVFTILFGSIINEFGGTVNDSLPSTSDIVNSIGSLAKWFLILAIVAFCTSFIQVTLQLNAAQQICSKLRRKYFRSLMSQDYDWYDQNNGGELTARVAGDVTLIQAGIGDKLTSAVQFLSMFFTGVIIAFIYGPLVTLVVLSVAPALIISGAFIAKVAASSTGDQLGAYGSAGAVASEVIALIRTVTAYNGQEQEAVRYEKELQKAYKAEVKNAIVMGIGLGFTMFVMFCVYAIAFKFGSTRLKGDDPALEPGDILTAFFSILIACMSLGQAAPSFKAFATAQGAAPRVYQVIDRQSDIDPLDDDDGLVLTDFAGNISFANVSFNYKNRKIDETKDDGEDHRPFVLQNFSVKIPSGTTHALVGESGCGKSTTVRLIERFYDVQEGAVCLDNTDVRQLNVKWLRSQMGYVGQMPTLFALTIKDNIALGASMVAFVDETTGKTVLKRQEVKDEDIIHAAKQANAHDFIMKLPEQYDTLLGERGALLSGGQKQRVCIARALIRNPKILILDESTAALDAQSERIVQEALEVASAGRTTITIAHRLSTVKNANVISVIEKGSIIESGKHADLLKIQGGAYRTLVEHQNIEAEKITSNKEQYVADGAATSTADVFNKSITKTKDGSLEGAKDEDEEEFVLDKGVYKRAFKLNTPEWWLILLGCIGAGLAGASFPIMAIIFSDILGALFEPESDDFDSTINRYTLYFVAIGVGALVGNFLQAACLGVSGEKLTLKLRRASFRAILRQDMGFFDHKDNSLGSLTTRLATEASMVRGVTGDTLGTLVFCLSTMLTGFIVAYLGCWRAALVVTAVFPLMGVAGSLQMKLMAGFDASAETRYASAGTVASEAVDNYDTVTSLGVQDVFMDKYNKELDGPLASGRKSALVAGFAFGVSEFLAQALWAVSFWVGAIFVRNDSCNFQELMKAITGLLFAGMMIGQVASFMPDVAKSRLSATKIFRLLDLEAPIDPTARNDTRPVISGNVGMEKVCFEYPTRPDVAVLRGLSMNVGIGKTLALVGASGCGKSTVVSLLERFYDPRSGSISMDNVNISSIDIQWMRQHLGLVSQEPDLFNCSIRDNIAYGLNHTDGTPVTDDMIIEAAKEANAHNFISELDEKYDTVVGPRGNRLSGGQKQRVAIARAIVRKPRLLLLDEATSALDAVSEHVVQDALERASAGRTTIAIAHRLSTVKDSDAIAVVSRGKIVEMGTHDQLLRVEDGEYANLVRNQLAAAEEV